MCRVACIHGYVHQPIMGLQLLTGFLLLIYNFLIHSANAYYGNEFYLGALKNHKSETTRLWLSVSTNSSNVLFTVETHIMQFSYVGNVSIANPSTIELPLQLVVEDHSYLNRPKGIHVFTHDTNEFISVVLFNWADNSVGDYISIPCSPYPISDSTQFVYYSVSTTSVDVPNNLWSQTLLVGCQDGTLITVYPTEQILIPILPGEIYSPAVAVLPGQKHSFILNAGETLFLGNANRDISGTKIISSNPLTVVSGHECGNVPTDTDSCEHLTEQIPPAETWGNKFILIPFKNRESGQYFKVIAKHNSTALSVICNQTIIEEINIEREGGHDTFYMDSNSYCYLTSSKPLLLVQLALGGQLDNVGDPIMIIQPPVQQYTDTVTFDVVKKDTFTMSFVNMATTERYSDIEYDGQPLEAADWIDIYDLDNNIVGYGYVMAVDPGAHTITHTSGRMSVTQYGFSIVEPTGYGHALGGQLNLLAETLYVSFDTTKYAVLENHTSVVVSVHCRASFTANSSVLVKTIPSDSRDLTVVNSIVECQQQQDHYHLITILINDDDLVEPVEEILVYLEAITDKEYISDNNQTTITIIDNDSVEVGFVQSLQLTQKELININIGIFNGTLQPDADITLTINVHVIINDTVYGTGVYQAVLTYYVPTLEIDFNITRILQSAVVEDYHVIVALDTPTHGNMVVSVRDVSAALFLPTEISSTPTIIIHSSNTLSDNVQVKTSSDIIFTERSTIISLKADDTVIYDSFCTTTVTVSVTADQTNDLQPLSIMIIIISASIIAKKAKPHPSPTIPGIVNPYIPDNNPKL